MMLWSTSEKGVWGTAYVFDQCHELDFCIPLQRRQLSSGHTQYAVQHCKQVCLAWQLAWSTERMTALAGVPKMPAVDPTRYT